MDEIVKPIAEYINTALGAAGLGGAAFAANWIRKVVGRYLVYVEAKMVRWLNKDKNSQLNTSVVRVGAAVSVIVALWEERHGKLSSMNNDQRVDAMEKIMKMAKGIISKAFPGETLLSSTVASVMDRAIKDELTEKEPNA